MCLLSATDPNGYSCACPDGYELSSDNTDCTCELSILVVLQSHKGLLIVCDFDFVPVQLLDFHLHLLLLVHVLTLGTRTVV